MRSAELLVVAALCLASPVGAQAPDTVLAPALGASAVREAASGVQADPLLAGKETTKRLQFKKSGDKKPKPAPDDPVRWWADLVANLSGGLRVAVWLVGAGLLIAALLRLRDWLIERDGAATPLASAPSHVGSLDIRPESLPRDVGGAARALWERGELRAALSLLYRGSLSRLVHEHGVPIRSASTENDCLRLAADRLAPASREYLQALIRNWQAVAYAQRKLPSADIEPLCADFDARLSAPGMRA